MRLACILLAFQEVLKPELQYLENLQKMNDINAVWTAAIVVRYCEI